MQNLFPWRMMMWRPWELMLSAAVAEKIKQTSPKHPRHSSFFGSIWENRHPSAIYPDGAVCSPTTGAVLLVKYKLGCGFTPAAEQQPRLPCRQGGHSSALQLTAPRPHGAATQRPPDLNAGLVTTSDGDQHPPGHIVLCVLARFNTSRCGTALGSAGLRPQRRGSVSSTSTAPLHRITAATMRFDCSNSNPWQTTSSSPWARNPSRSFNIFFFARQSQSTADSSTGYLVWEHLTACYTGVGAAV